MALELLGTSGCHLCEEAEARVEQALERTPQALKLTWVEIADDPDLLESFGLQIPVLRWREKLLYWPFTAEDVAVFLLAPEADPHHS